MDETNEVTLFREVMQVGNVTPLKAQNHIPHAEAHPRKPTVRPNPAKSRRNLVDPNPNLLMAYWR